MVAAPTGDIDLANVERVSADLQECVPDDASGLVIDLARVRYIDSTGVHMLFELIRRLAATRQRVAFAVPEGAPVRRLLKITNVNEVAPVAPTAAEAITALEHEQDAL